MAKKIDSSKIAKESIEWADRKRTLFGLPWSFTRYRLTKTRLISEIGLFTTNTNEILLYRIMDIELRRTLGQKIFGVGDIYLFTADPSSPHFTIKSVKQSDDVKNLISTMVEAERTEKNVTGREMYGTADGADDGGGHSGHHHEGV
ncbi:hypothetical protein AGMMS49983_00190 [Clostridia bacterium]|nr:hypothetical protein AGMMS49983_00190 [Clostridia bacterium]